jgi:hypothetical protein
VVPEYNSTHLALADWYNPLARHLKCRDVCPVAVVGSEPPEDKRRGGGVVKENRKGENRESRVSARVHLIRVMAPKC